MDGQHENGLFENLMSQMCILWKQEQLCDIRLQVHNSVIPAHRVVLAALSPYFRAMFCSHLNESQQSTVNIQGFSPAVISMIVEYAYTSVINLTEENVQKILHAASVMQIETLENECTKFLSEQMHPSNCLGIRAFAQSLGCYNLFDAADNYCQDNFLEVSENEEFYLLSSREMINLVARDELKVPKEEDVYTAVMRWLDYAPEERAEDVVKIMEKVRLPLVQWEFLMGKVSKHRLFTNNEQCRQFLQQARAFQASSFHPDLNNFAFNEAVLLAQPRIGFGATDYLHVIGGETDNRELVAAMEGFNPVTNTTSQLSPMPTARRSLGVVIVENMIYTVGGSDGTAAVGNLEVYDIGRNAWSTRASLCVARTSVSAAALDGRVFAIGGHDGRMALSSVEVYDSEVNSWTFTSDLQTVRSMASSLCLKNKLYVLGGYDGALDLRSVEKFEPGTMQWVSIASMHESRSMFDAAVVDDLIVVVGGSSGEHCLSSAEMYNPTTDQWTVLQCLTIARRGLGIAVIGGVLYAAGGHDGRTYLSSVEKYNKYTQGWTLVGHLELPRGRFGFV